MASMGYNSIRLGVLWAGLEPVEGEYNMTYLEQVVECVNIAQKYGIYPVLDMHQDVFNRRFCGNGVPDWVPQPPEFNFPYPIEVEYEVDENGYPSRYDLMYGSWWLITFMIDDCMILCKTTTFQRGLWQCSVAKLSFQHESGSLCRKIVCELCWTTWEICSVLG